MTEHDYPYVALFTQATGIHPSTGRLLTVDAVTFDAAGRVGEEFHAVLNPGTDPGPAHTHRPVSYTHLTLPTKRIV